MIPDWIVAARGVALVAGVALIPIIWWLTAAFVRSPLLRLIPPLAMALTPLPIRYSLTTMSDLPYLALFLVALGFAARKRSFPAGVFAGASYVIRPEALVALAVMSALSWRRPRQVGLMLASAALFVIPYVVFVGVRDHRWTLTPKSTNIAAGSWEAAEDRADEGAVPTDFASRLARFGGETVRLYPKRAFETVKTLARHSGLLPILLAPAALAGPAVILLAGLAHIVFLPLTFIGARVRYLFPFLPILWILSVVTIETVSQSLRRRALAGLLALSIAAGAFLGRDLYTMNEDGSFPELVEAGTWLKEFATPQTVVYDRKPYVAFYAGAEGRYLPAGSYEAILGEIRAKGGDYLVVNDWVTRHFRPELLPLVSDPAAIEGESRLSPIYFERSERGYRTIIYRVIRPGGPPPFPGEAEMRDSIIRFLRQAPVPR